MADKPNSLHTLGLVLNGHTLKGAQLTLRKGKPALDRLYEIPLQTQTAGSIAGVKPLYTNEEGQALLLAMPHQLVVSMLNAGDVLVRPLEVNLKKESDIDAVLPFQAEPLLPYPADNAVLDRIKVGETPESVLLTLLAVRKDHLNQHLEECLHMNIEPEVVSCTPVALAAFAQLFSPNEAPQYVVHIGHINTTCVLVKEGKLLAAQAFSQGTTNLTAAFTRDNSGFAELSQFDPLDFAAIKKEIFPALSEALETMRLEMTRTLYALAKQAKGQEVSQILLTGEAGHLTNLGYQLCNSLNKPVVAPAALPEFDLPLPQLQRFAVAIGGALTALSDYPNEVDFRQGEFTYPDPWKRYKIPLAIYMGACVALALAFFFFGNAYIKYKEDGLREEYSALLTSMHKPYTAFEKEFKAKLAGKKGGEEEEVATPLMQLGQDDIMARVGYLDKALQSTPDLYPLLPNVPTVSDVLAWLSTHPNVVSKDPKNGHLNALLQIESFNYTVVKRPDLTKKSEKYQVKVEIEFSSLTPKLAREFHDALIAPNAMVDPKAEVKWSTNRGLYRASFFLKDKTVYPSSS